MPTRNELPPQIKKVVENGVTVWAVRISIGGRENRSQLKRKFGTEKEALDFYDEHRSQKRQGVTALVSKVTVEQAVQAYLDGHHKIKGTTDSAYVCSLQPLRRRHGKLLLTELTKAHLDKLVKDLMTGTYVNPPFDEDGNPIRFRRVRTWKACTIGVMLRHIKRMLKSYVAQGLLVRNVAELVVRPQGASKYKKFDTFTAAEVRKVLTAAGQPMIRIEGKRTPSKFRTPERLEHAWYLSLSGLRRGEMTGLRWSDIDWDDGQYGSLTVAEDHNRVLVKGTPEEGSPKTENGERTLPLTKELRAVLRAAWKRRLAEKLAAGELWDGSGDHVVCDELGRAYNPRQLSFQWKMLLRRAGVKHIRLQDARHTCGTLMAINKVPAVIIADWLGHGDASFTMRTYVHPQKDALAQAAEVMQTVMQDALNATEAAVESASIRIAQENMQAYAAVHDVLDEIEERGREAQ